MDQCCNWGKCSFLTIRSVRGSVVREMSLVPKSLRHHHIPCTAKKVFDIGWSQIVLRAVRLPVLLSRLGLERDLRSVRARSVLRSWIQEVLRMLQGLPDLFWTFKHGLQIVPKSIPGNFFKKIWANPGLFFAYFRPFLITISIIQIEKV